MSFLDNLENNLKALENRDQGGIGNSRAEEAERERAIAAQPWAERLKQSPWTQQLIQHATRSGYRIRAKVTPLWIGTALRLEARGQRLELRPTPEGILAVYLNGADEFRRELLDLEKDPAGLAAVWMETVENGTAAD